MRKTPTSIWFPRFFLLLAAFFLAHCDEDEAEAGASTADEVGRAVVDVELPVSLRTGDQPPTGAAKVEATTEQLRVNGKVVIPLEKGRVPESEQSDGTIPKLSSHLSGAQGVALRMQANLAYDTLAMVLNTAAKAGIHQAALQVRKIGGSSETGWLGFPGYTVSSKAEELPAIPGTEAPSWNVFTEKWQSIYEACRMAQSGNCAYVNENFAQGGTLRMELMASGRGINVNYFRRGLTKAQEAAEEKKLQAQTAAKKEDFLQGRITEEELVEALLLGDPSTYALFQFRYQEAIKEPSPIRGTVSPICESRTCGIVFTADAFTPIMRLASLAGAAFPDGSTAPRFAFELPWTERPPPEDLTAFIEEQKSKGL